MKISLPLNRFLIFAVLFFGLSISSYSQEASASPVAVLTTYNDIASLAQSIATIVAIILGAIWAYYKFVKNRVFKNKLELQLSGRIISKDDKNYLVHSIQVKNVGSSKVQIENSKSGLLISGYSDGLGDDEDVGVVQVLERHEWIEPGETVSEENIYSADISKYFALKIHLNVVAAYTRFQRLRRWLYRTEKGKQKVRANTWSATLIVNYEQKEEESTPSLEAMKYIMVFCCSIINDEVSLTRYETSLTREDETSRKFEELLRELIAKKEKKKQLNPSSETGK